MEQYPKLPAPMLAPCLLWCLGIVLGRYVAFPAIAALGLGAALLAAAILFRRLRFWLVLALCLVLGAAREQAAQRPSPLDQVLAKRGRIQQEADFTVTKLLSRQAGVYEIRLRSLAGVRIREPLQLMTNYPLRPGNRYSALLEIRQGKRDPILDTFPARHLASVRQNLRQLPGGGELIPIARWRAELLEDLDDKLGDKAIYAKALLLSDSSAKQHYREDLRHSGMTHLIVVSGLHIWFIYAMCMILLNALLPRRLAEGVFLVLICFYAALNHWAPPVTRAILMIGFRILGRWRSTPLSWLQTLSLSLLAITVAAPGQLFEAGLQMSFFSVAVIVLAIPRISRIKEKGYGAWLPRRGINRLIDMMLMSAVVGLAIAPLTLFYFGSASLNGIIGNLLGLPLTAILLASGFCVLLIPGGNLLSEVFVNGHLFVLHIFEDWLSLVAKLPLYLENKWINGWQLGGALLLVGVALYLLRNPRFRWLMLPAAVLGLCLFILPTVFLKPAAGVYVFACGTADCLLARLPDGQILLVDCGPKSYDSDRSWAGRKLLPWLKRQGIGQIDLLVLSHLDADHSGGFPELARGVRISRIAVSDEVLEDSRWHEWKAAGILRRSRIVAVRDTMSLWLGESRLKFLHPDRHFQVSGSNEGSLVFRLDQDGRKYLFTGDADLAAEQYLGERYPSELRADYLKAAHHGSRSSNSGEFVRLVDPREVWLTVSATNRWGFPHPEPLQAFRDQGSRLRSTADGSFFVPFTQND